MATYQYQNIVDEIRDVIYALIENEVIPEGDIYQFEGGNNEGHYKRLFQFCQENLLERWPKYPAFQNARFYFIDDPEVEAFAVHPGAAQGYFIIGISKGVVDGLLNFFCSNDLIDHPGLSDYQELNSVLLEKLQVSISLLMAQTGVQYTFFHELGHFIQFANIIDETDTVHERSINRHLPYNELSHVLEYDADQHGASVTVNHIHNFYLNSLPKELQTQENFEKLLITHLVGIFCYVMIIWGSWDTPIYYKKSSHPHAIIRFFCIGTIAIDISQRWFPAIDQGRILNEVFRILNIYCKANGRPRYIPQFLELLRREHANMMRYMRYILDRSEQMDFLAVNSEHKTNVL